MGIFFIVLIIIIVLAGFIGWEFHLIAKQKGYPQMKYFWWSFLFSYVGYLMVIALPDHSVKPTAQNEYHNVSEELPEL